MNKVFNINLGGYPFTIDEDAYDHLRSYLESIHNHFRQTEGYEEITHDIEARLAELFIEHLHNRPIVNLQDVEDAIAVMGRPEEFGADPMQDASSATGTNEDNFHIKTGKRLFRDPEEKVVGGVAAGLAAYFGIQDPIWIRLFFGLFLFTGGIGVPLYFILWALMPEAKTASDRLAMKGEPINISNISKIITEEFTHLSEKMTELGEELSGKKKSPKPNDDENKGTAQRFTAMNDAFQQSWESTRTHLPDIGRALRGVLIAIAIFFIFVFAMLWLGIIVGLTISTPFLTNFFPGQEAMTVIAAINVLFVVGIPTLFTILSIVRLVFRRRISRSWVIGLWVFWFINLFSGISIGGRLVQEFMAEDSVNLTREMPAQPQGMLSLHFHELESQSEVLFGFDGEGVHLPNAPVTYLVRQSPDATWKIAQSATSRAYRKAEAHSLATALQVPLQWDENSLSIPATIPFEQLSKWRNQQATVEILVPVGGQLQLDESTRLSGSKIYPRRVNGNINAGVATYRYEMTEAGLLKCLDCPAENKAVPNQESDASPWKDFNSLQLSGPVKATVQQGDTYGVRITGEPSEKARVATTQDGGLLSIHLDAQSTDSPVRVYITLPSLQGVVLEHTDDVLIKGFDGESMRIEARGGFDLKAEVATTRLDVVADEAVSVEFTGTTDELVARLQGDSRLDTDRGQVAKAHLFAAGDSRIKISSKVQIVEQEILEDSSLRVVD